MGKADLLSRHADHPQGEHDNKDITIFPEEKIHLLLTKSTEDQFLQKIRNLLLQKPPENLGNTQVECKDKLIYFKECLYISHNDSLRQQLLHNHHNPPTVGHPDIKKTLKLLD